MGRSMVRELMNRLDPPLFNGVPVLKEWRHEGYICRVIHRGLFFCAYVSIPKKHPLSQMDITDMPIKVHGGVTFKEEEGNHVWLGWDCAHATDSILIYGQWTKGHKWTLEEVIDETNRMANQLRRRQK